MKTSGGIEMEHELKSIILLTLRLSEDIWTGIFKNLIDLPVLLSNTLTGFCSRRIKKLDKVR